MRVGIRGASASHKEGSRPFGVCADACCAFGVTPAIAVNLFEKRSLGRLQIGCVRPAELSGGGMGVIWWAAVR